MNTYDPKTIGELYGLQLLAVLASDVEKTRAYHAAGHLYVDTECPVFVAEIDESPDGAYVEYLGTKYLNAYRSTREIPVAELSDELRAILGLGTIPPERIVEMNSYYNVVRSGEYEVDPEEIKALFKAGHVWPTRSESDMQGGIAFTSVPNSEDELAKVLAWREAQGVSKGEVALRDVAKTTTA